MRGHTLAATALCRDWFNIATVVGSDPAAETLALEPGRLVWAYGRPQSQLAVDMKIAHVVTRLAGGGTERNLAASLEVEVRAGHEVTVICGAVSEAYRRQVPEDVMFLEVPSLQRNPSVKADLAAWGDLRSILNSGRYDVVHSHQAKAGALARVAIKRRSDALVVHTVHMANFGAGYSRMSSLLYKNIERYCARRTDFLCFVGVELKSDYSHARIVGKRGSLVLRSSLDVDKFLGARRLRDGAASAKAHRQGAPTAVLMVGALEPRKRHALALRALENDLRGGRLELTIAGDGPERARDCRVAHSTWHP